MKRGIKYARIAKTFIIIAITTKPKLTINKATLTNWHNNFEE